jgi:hypothetical protein
MALAPTQNPSRFSSTLGLIEQLIFPNMQLSKVSKDLNFQNRQSYPDVAAGES